MVFNSRSVKKFQKNAANVAKFHKKFPIRSGVIKKSYRCYKFENNNIF